MASDDLVDCVVVDNGSGFTKVGYSGEDSPRSYFATVVGTKMTTVDDESGDFAAAAAPASDSTGGDASGHIAGHNFIIGDEVQKLRDAEHKYGERVKMAKEKGTPVQPLRERLLSVARPVQFGEIKNWDEIEEIWQHSFRNELKIDPASFPVLLTDVPLNDKKSREKMTQIMFEKFSVKGFYIQTQAVLSLFASGRTTGIVVESGHDISHTVPVFEGYAIRHSILGMRLGGRALTEYYTKHLTAANDFPFEKNNKMSVIEKLKEASTLVTTTYYDRAMREGGEEYAHELPDGTVIKVPWAHRITCPEILFRPSLLEDRKDVPGIGDIASKSIQFCDKDLQRALYGSVVIAGGTSLIAGFGDRLQQEIKASTGGRKAVTVHADSQRKCAAWIGGSMIASLSTFNHMKISKQEYDDTHAATVHRKCF